MFIKFNEHDLISFFESDPIPISTPEVGDFIYSIVDSRGVSICLTLSTYGKTCSIDLSINSNPLLEMNIHSVESIELLDQNKCLRIQQADHQRDVCIYNGTGVFVIAKNG